MNNKQNKNWYVIRGGPSSGKTTTVNLLKERGYITTFEHARHYLNTQQLTKTKNIRIHLSPDNVFALMDDFSKTGMHMSESSMMMRSKLKSEQVSINPTGVGASYLLPKEWYYKILSFFFANWYCNLCLNNMLNNTKMNLEDKISKQAEGGVQA